MNTFENLTFRQANLADSVLLISMINEVYKKAEAEFWNDDYFRISEKEYIDYVNKEWLYVACNANQIVGCVVIKQLNKLTSSFSMLVCHPDHLKKGVGGKLVIFSEQIARKRGSEIMQLEILTDREELHEQKLFLKSWYSSIGYKFKKSINFEELEPETSEFTICDLVFKIYTKKL